MRKNLLMLGLLICMAILLAGCTSAEEPGGTGGDKVVTIVVESEPNPAVVGDVLYTLTITDENNNPLEGAAVDVEVDHTDMIGMTMNGPATEQGEGKYAITATMSMSGNWKMTVYVRKDGLDYQEDIELTIR